CVTSAMVGRRGGVTGAFAPWGTRVYTGLGGDVWTWWYWQMPGHASALHASVLADATSVMNIGVVLGALVAATLAGRFAPKFTIPLRSVIAAVVGGLLMGYGARLAYGCNIGAYFSGIASGSLHGWVWLVAAFAGNIVGVKIRPLFLARKAGAAAA